MFALKGFQTKLGVKGFVSKGIVFKIYENGTLSVKAEIGTIITELVD